MMGIFIISGFITACMKIRHRVKNCLNCGALLDDVYNYCPMCGQDNNDNNMSFGILIHDFFSNYFAFDSKFLRTVVPFLIKPGFLTNRYNEGQRVSYAHPLRLYLVISLFYFFVWSIMVKNMLNEVDSNIAKAKVSVRSLQDLSRKQRDDLRAILADSTLTSIQTKHGNKSLGDLLRENTNKEERVKIMEALSPGLLDSLRWDEDDTIAIAGEEGSNVYLYKSPDGKDDDSDDEDNSFLLPVGLDRILEFSEQRELSEEQIMDSLNLKDASRFDRYSVRQAIRISRADKSQVGAYVVKNLPIMMLILIPIFALILKVLYVRRKAYYINHIIHALHLHSFAYFFYGMTLVLTQFVIKSEGMSNSINFISFILVSTYAYVSFLRVYKQGWFKTLIKFNIAGFFYSLTILIFFLMEMLISFALF